MLDALLTLVLEFLFGLFGIPDKELEKWHVRASFAVIGLVILALGFLFWYA